MEKNCPTSLFIQFCILVGVVFLIYLVSDLFYTTDEIYGFLKDADIRIEESGE